jgi:nucleotide-binding universal stress UspA family protein
MTPTTWLVFAMVGWTGIGVVLAAILGRRGFDGLSWLLIGVVLGPMAIPIAWNCVRRDENLHAQVIAVPTRATIPNGVDVLVGFDGSPESKAALATASRLFGDQLGRLTLATVVPFDEARDVEISAAAALEAEAADHPRLAAALEIVRGHPATALAAAALEGGYDLLVIGATGAGRAHLFGSAAKELAHHSTVPVLLAGQPATTAPSDGSAAVERA